MKDCQVNQFSSRVCELGVMGCDVQHDAPDSSDLLSCRVRCVGETMRPDDVVLIDDMFMPIGFSTSFDGYYAGQIVTTSMSGKVIYKAT